MHCLSCGYDLRALEEGRCPECGRGFSPSEPKSFGSDNTHRLLRWAKIVGWFTALISAGVGTAAAMGIATGQHDLVLLIALWMFAVWPVVLAFIAYIALLTASGRSPRIRAIVVAMLLFVFNVSLLTEWPIRLAFYAHRDSLNQLAQQVNQNPSSVITPQHVGIYTLTSISFMPNPKRTLVFMRIHGGDGPDYFIYGMTDAEIKANFNLWSYKRLDADWHIVHED